MLIFRFLPVFPSILLVRGQPVDVEQSLGDALQGMREILCGICLKICPFLDDECYVQRVRRELPDNFILPKERLFRHFDSIRRELKLIQAYGGGSMPPSQCPEICSDISKRLALAMLLDLEQQASLGTLPPNHPGIGYEDATAEAAKKYIRWIASSRLPFTCDDQVGKHGGYNDSRLE